MRTIAVAAHKGGDGKTTLAVNLAAEFARVGQRVLAVDCEPQGALGEALGLPEGKPTLYEVLAGTATLAQAARATGVDNLTVIPADLDLAAADLELPRTRGWQTALRSALAPAAGAVDLVVIDTPPGHGVLPIVGLAAADAALIAMQPQYFSYRTIARVLGTINQVRQVNPGLQLLGIVPTMVAPGRRRTRHEVEVLQGLADRYPDLLLPAIPRRVVIADAALAGEPVSHFAPTSDATESFRVLAQEIARREQTPDPQRA